MKDIRYLPKLLSRLISGRIGSHREKPFGVQLQQANDHLRVLLRQIPCLGPVGVGVRRIVIFVWRDVGLHNLVVEGVNPPGLVPCLIAGRGFTLALQPRIPVVADAIEQTIKMIETPMEGVFGAVMLARPERAVTSVFNSSPMVTEWM